MSRQSSSSDDVVSVGREECDLSNANAIRDLVRRVKPAVIVNAAAYTAVDRAETERDLCYAINANGTRHFGGRGGAAWGAPSSTTRQTMCSMGRSLRPMWKATPLIR